MHATELIEGHMYQKYKFIDVEDDTDYIDNYVGETPYDKMSTEATKIDIENNKEAPLSSSMFRNTGKMEEILQKVEDLEINRTRKIDNETSHE